MNQTRRRQLLLVTGALLAGPSALSAQPAQRLRHIGVLSGQTKRVFARSRKALESALAKLGWVPGRNLSITYRFTDGTAASAHLLLELVAARIEVLLVLGGASNQTVKSIVTSVPVVTIFNEDPVVAGFATTLARPGGNMTGVAYPIGDDWDLPKQLEIVREAFPQLRRLGVLTGAGGAEHWRGVPAKIATRLGIELLPSEATDAPTIRRAVTELATTTDAVWVELQPTWPAVEEIARWLEEAGIRSVSDVIEFVEAGGLLVYGVGVNLTGVLQQMARYVDHLLRGRKAGELPIESPPAAKLVVNKKTARAIGYVIPPTILLRADHAIE